MRYRLYELSPAGRVVRGRDIIADDDSVALAIASAESSHQQRELWQGVERLAVLEPDQKAA